MKKNHTGVKHLERIVKNIFRDRLSEARHEITSKSYSCNICNREFPQMFKLNTHLRTHTGEKPYVCNPCNKAFTRKSFLDQHIRTHTGEKLYECNFCQRVFARWNVLMLHLKTHTAEKTYNCQFTNQRLTHLDDHNYHINSGQNPYKTVSCQSVVSSMTEGCNGSTSPKRSSTYTHDDSFCIENLLAENQYNGTICHKRSAQTNAVKSHKRAHTAEKPYKCNTCRKIFVERTSLRRHIETHNRENSELCQSVVLGMTERNHRPISSKTFTMGAPDNSCFDEKEFPATENLQHFTSMQSLNLSPHRNHFSGHQVTFAADINPCVVRSYGCGLCDEMFEIEKEFMEHCYDHYDIGPNFTFVDLFEGHHSSCCC